MANFEIRKPSAERNLNLLIYGPAGSGKTHLSATAAQSDRFKNVLFLDVEGGAQTLNRPGFEDIDIIGITEFETFARVFEFLKAHVKLRDSKNAEDQKRLDSLNAKYSLAEGTRYRTVVIDSLSEVAKLVMYRLLAIDPDLARLDGDIKSAEIQDWGKSAEYVRLLVRGFRNLDINSIVICSENLTQDNMKMLHHDIALPGKLASEIPGFFDVVGWLNSAASKDGSVTRKLYVKQQKGNPFVAKDRLHGDGIVAIDSPTIDRIVAPQ